MSRDEFPLRLMTLWSQRLRVCLKIQTIFVMKLCYIRAKWIVRIHIAYPKLFGIDVRKLQLLHCKYQQLLTVSKGNYVFWMFYTCEYID